MSRRTDTYQDLTVWQLSMDLVIDSYKLIKQFPSIDRYGLENELFSSAVSIPTCIAEAHARSSTSVYLENIATAIGILARLETQILIAERLFYCNHTQREKFIEKLNSLKWLLVRLRKSFITKSDYRDAQTHEM